MPDYRKTPKQGLIERKEKRPGLEEFKAMM